MSATLLTIAIHILPIGPPRKRERVASAFCSFLIVGSEGGSMFSVEGSHQGDPSNVSCSEGGSMFSVEGSHQGGRGWGPP
jgi:hypothetical protein